MVLVSFALVSRSASGMADSLAKQGVDPSCNLSAPVTYFLDGSGIYLLYGYLCILIIVVGWLYLFFPPSILVIITIKKKNGTSFICTC